MKQSLEPESVQSGESMNLQCSLLPKEDSVYWFYIGAAVTCKETLFCEVTKKETGMSLFPLIFRLLMYDKTFINAFEYYTSNWIFIWLLMLILCNKYIFVNYYTKWLTILIEVCRDLHVYLAFFLISGQEGDPLPLVLGVLLAFCIIVIAILVFSRGRGWLQALQNCSSFMFMCIKWKI